MFDSLTPVSRPPLGVVGERGVTPRRPHGSYETCEPYEPYAGGTGVASWSLRRCTRAPAQARRAVRGELTACGVPESVMHTAELLVSELVTNALRHAVGALVLKVSHGGVVRCWVEDGSPVLPARHAPEATCESGRGLVLVEELSQSWGSYPTARGKATWFEIDVTP